MKNSPIAAKHLELNAKMADFGGWLMPIEYPKTGVIQEYNSVRTQVGVFDVSHLGKISVVGEGSLEFLNTALTNDLNRIIPGQAQYTLICNDNGGVIDDLIVYQNSASNFFLVPNASNNAAVFEVLKSTAPSQVTVSNLHEDFAVFAVQGPKSVSMLDSLGIDTDIDYMQFLNAKIGDSELIVCRTGYTGELGFEIIPSWQNAEKVWSQLMQAAEKFNGTACGLGARDILRTEMGYPLHGHEISLSISPIEASASWAVAFDKADFTGKEVLKNQKQNGTKLKLKAILATDRAIPRKDMQVKNASGEIVGLVTSGTFSPALKKGIGLALINSDISKGDKVLIDVRGKDSVFEIVSLPFVPSKVR
ncbi:MAG: glycine cleavage system aminomethyltransferase GcvT [Candidatus Nanopelagicus sp.]